MCKVLLARHHKGSRGTTARPTLPREDVDATVDTTIATEDTATMPEVPFRDDDDVSRGHAAKRLRVGSSSEIVRLRRIILETEVALQNERALRLLLEQEASLASNAAQSFFKLAQNFCDTADTVEQVFEDKYQCLRCTIADWEAHQNQPAAVDFPEESCVDSDGGFVHNTNDTSE